jgi:DNA polymerase III sliding clamp (beta) subunit (PCNA family)
MPELPFPEDTVPVSGLRSLVRNTVFAVSENTETPLLHCVRLSIGPDGLKASGTNSFCIIEAEGDKNCKGQTQILLPAHTLKVLSAVSSDSDVYEMGLAGKSVVFWNGTLLFSARLMEGNYPDTTRMLDGFRADYTVNLDAEELANAISMTAPVGESEKRIELSFGEHELYLRSLTEHGRAMTPVKALVLNAPNTPFYYNYEKLLAYLRLLKGNVTLEFDRRGLLVIRPGETRYMQSPMRPPKGSAQAAQAA